jgi:predicted metalloenzyme YecM
MNDLTKIIGNYSDFLDIILAKVQTAGFDMSDFVQIDHVCYRTTSTENYLNKKAQLQDVAELLGEQIVNNRPISAFRLSQPIIHGQWRIDALELPAPKLGNKHLEGLEHIEFVIFDSIQTFLKKYKGKPFEMRAANRGVNPEIGLQLDEYSVKFHLLNLPTVIYIENKLGINEVIDSE